MNAVHLEDVLHVGLGFGQLQGNVGSVNDSLCPVAILLLTQGDLPFAWGASGDRLYGLLGKRGLRQGLGAGLGGGSEPADASMMSCSTISIAASQR